MTPTPYVGGRKPRNAKPHSRDRAERTLDEIITRNPLCRQGDGGRGEKSGLISSGITPPRRACPRRKAGRREKKGRVRTGA